METATIPTPPLALRLDAPRPAVVAGESVVLQVTHTVYDPSRWRPWSSTARAPACG